MIVLLILHPFFIQPSWFILYRFYVHPSLVLQSSVSHSLLSVRPSVVLQPFFIQCSFHLHLLFIQPPAILHSHFIHLSHLPIFCCRSQHGDGGADGGGVGYPPRRVPPLGHVPDSLRSRGHRPKFCGRLRHQPTGPTPPPGQVHNAMIKTKGCHFQ